MARQSWPYSRPGDVLRRAALDRLYAELPKLECRGLCDESCGPIVMGRVEWSRVCKAKGERRTQRDFVCPYLEDHRCSVYDVRPMLCRLWGIVEAMPCTFGCVPERYLTREEGYEFLERVVALQ